MKRILSSLLLLITFCCTMSANDVVMVGYFCACSDSAEFSVIAEYSGSRIKALEIDLGPDGNVHLTKVRIEGESRIRKFRECLLSALDQYYDYEARMEPGRKYSNVMRRLEEKWPKMTFIGHMVDNLFLDRQTSDDVVRGVDRPSDTDAYFVIDRGGGTHLSLYFSTQESIFHLSGVLDFWEPEYVLQFAHMLELDYIRERIQLKQKLMNGK